MLLECAPMTQPIILQVAVPAPLRKTFDYLPPHGFPEGAALLPGIRVEVPFGRQKMVGVLLAVRSDSHCDPATLKAATAILDHEPLLPPALLSLMLWAAEYYQHPVGETLATALPALLRKGEPLIAENRLAWRLANTAVTVDAVAKNATLQRKLIEHLTHHPFLPDSDKGALGFSLALLKSLQERGRVEPFTRDEAPVAAVTIHPGSYPLNEEQAALVEQFRHRTPGFSAILLEGITGSGKTEVYLQLIASVLEQGLQALVLVPEIGLTPQTLERFEKRFSCPMAIFHSSLTDHQRLLYWQQARSGEARIIIGTRSAIFTVMKAPGLIIVDEEHDLSYKQQESLRYSARDLACMRASLEKIPVLLGSATPTLESLYNCQRGKHQHWQLTQRAGGARPPEVRLLDIRHQPMADGIAEVLLPEIGQTLAQGEQVLLFINRRGFAPTLLCHDCGWISNCHACDARLTLHMGANHLRCHHCLAISPIPHRCPGCQSSELVSTGAGTERIDRALRQHFPEFPLFRIDRDTTATKGSMPEMLAEIQHQQAAILVGTQMLAKGHHFPNVTLVIVLEADAALAGTDYRALERFGQLLTQVTGRAGREQKPGRAVIQTHFPQHPKLNQLVHHGYHRFAMDILAERQRIGLPPFSYQALVRLEDQDAVQAVKTLQQLRDTVSGVPGIQLLGPYPASLQRRAHYFRYQLLLTARERAVLRMAVATLIRTAEGVIKPHRQRWSVDIDPQEMG